MKLLVTNIARIVGLRPADTERVCGAAMAELPELENAWLWTAALRPTAR